MELHRIPRSSRTLRLLRFVRRHDSVKTGALNLGSTTNSVREAQILDSAASRASSEPDLSPLTAMTIGRLGLDELRNPLHREEFRQIH